VFEERGSVFRGVNGNVSFTVINFLLFKHSPYFFDHTSFSRFRCLNESTIFCFSGLIVLYIEVHPTFRHTLLFQSSW
jgi:hypothetical protein